jgi:hypothetical protein
MNLEDFRQSVDKSSIKKITNAKVRSKSRSEALHAEVM